MSYDIIEASVHDGDSVELYEFTLANTVWRFTSNALDYTYNGNTYEARPISRGKVERMGEMNRVAMDIEVDSQNPVVDLFVITQPRNTISVRIYSGHRNDEMRLIFSGRVLTCKWGSNRKPQLHCEPIITSWKRQSLKTNFGLNCPYVVYRGRCRATRNHIAGTIATISGLTITTAAAATVTNGRLIGGIIAVGTSSRTITSHSGDQITVTAQLDDAAVGDSLSLLIGCNKSTTACKDWHNNINNFGGEPYVPKNNPFNGRLA